MSAWLVALQALTLAVIGAFVTILTLVLNNRAKQGAEKIRLAEKEADRQAAIDKEERDYARQDLVANRVEQATRATLTKLEAVEDLGIVTHALVNADKTVAMRYTLTLMQEMIDFKRVMGIEPTQQALDAVTELEGAIEARLADQRTAEKRIETDKKTQE